MRTPVWTVLVLLAACTMSGSGQTRAAQTPGAIVGVVFDRQGAVLPGVSVALDGLLHRDTVTDDRGEFRFDGVAPGSYTVTSMLAGFRQSALPVRVVSGQTTSLPVILEVSALTETITVTAEAPLVNASTTGERYAAVERNGFHRVATTPLSTFSVDVDTASYANVRRFLTDGELPPAGAVRVEELVNYFRYDYPAPKGDAPFSVTTELTDCPWNADHRLVLIGLKGRDVPLRDTPPRNLVFLIDVSGPMQDHDKLPLVRQGLRALADTLTARDRVSIVVYAGASGLALPTTSGADTATIVAALDRLEAGGSTNGGEGIELAYRQARASFVRDGVNRVVLATDGDFNVGTTSDDALVRLIERERESGVFLSVLGVGEGNLNDQMMEQLADSGNGNYSYLDSVAEARRVLIEEAAGTFITIAKDVKIQVEFNPAVVAAYRLVGYEDRRLDAEDFTDDAKDAGDIGAGHTVTALYEVAPVGAAVPTSEIGPLRYQPAAQGATRRFLNEALTVRLRYKTPDGNTSRALQVRLANRVSAMSRNAGFASAVAEFALVLQGADADLPVSIEAAAARARAYLGPDPGGYRAEFVTLIERAERLRLATAR